MCTQAEIIHVKCVAKHLKRPFILKYEKEFISFLIETYFIDFILMFQEHMATHTGEDIYKCMYCSQTFKSSGNMYQHRKKQHKEDILKDRNKVIKLENNLETN